MDPIFLTIMILKPIEQKPKIQFLELFSLSMFQNYPLVSQRAETEALGIWLDLFLLLFLFHLLNYFSRSIPVKKILNASEQYFFSQFWKTENKRFLGLFASHLIYLINSFKVGETKTGIGLLRYLKELHSKDFSYLADIHDLIQVCKKLPSIV